VSPPVEPGNGSERCSILSFPAHVLRELKTVLQHISFPKVLGAFWYLSAIRIYNNIFWKRSNDRLITQFIQLREEHRLRVFENRVLRRMFGPKRDEVTGGWRNLYNDEDLHYLYSPPSILRIIMSRG
jgi:hypothetical protein